MVCPDRPGDFIVQNGYIDTSPSVKVRQYFKQSLDVIAPGEFLVCPGR